MNSKDKLALIRAKLKQEEEKKNNNGNSKSYGPSPMYPFWSLVPGTESVLRFLPDGNEDNPFPWLETNIIRLPFPGVKGQSPKNFELRVPCVEMWGDSCPVMSHIRKEKWFDDDDTKELGSQYWKKRSWVMHGFVVDDGINEEEKPENPIRLFKMGFQLFNIVKSGVLDPELEDSPDDFREGTDFIIRQELQAGRNNYTTSKFSRKSRSLSEEELAAIDKFDIPDLNTYRPIRPDESQLNDIFNLFIASVEGDFYDPDRFGHLPWRPRGVEKGTSTPSGSQESNSNASSSASSVLNKLKQEKSEPETEETESKSGPDLKAPPIQQNDAASILAAVRNRNKS